MSSTAEWSANCEVLLDYLEKKQSALRPDDYSMEYQYKTVRLQVERGDARREERVKALRIVFIELSDEQFQDCPIDLRTWLRNSRTEQAVEKRRQQQMLRNKAVSDPQQSGSVAHAAARSGNGGVVATEAKNSDEMLLESPVHSDASSNDPDLLSNSDIFKLSADSTALSAQLAHARQPQQHHSSSSNNSGSSRMVGGDVVGAGDDNDVTTMGLHARRRNRKRITSRRSRRGGKNNGTSEDAGMADISSNDATPRAAWSTTPVCIVCLCVCVLLCVLCVCDFCV